VDQLARDLVWSDPDPDVGGERDNESRGAGKFYGLDVVREFLESEGLHTLIRSHQSVYNGVDEVDCGDGKMLYTVFSATDYPNFEGCNQAGVIVYDHEHGMSIDRFNSEEFDDALTSQRTQRSKGEFTELQVSLRDLIYVHQGELRERLWEEADSNGRVHADRWCEVMKAVVGLDIPWAHVQPVIAHNVKRLTVDKESGESHIVETELVSVEHFLGHYSDDVSEDAEKLFKNWKHLMAVFKLLDTDGNGSLDFGEFKKGMELVDRRLAESQRFSNDGDGWVERMFAEIDIDGNGEIDLHEFEKIADDRLVKL
jgi:Ca2+-binding EF-hand superfamily protein